MARLDVSRLGDQGAESQIVTNQYGEEVAVNPFTGRDKDGNVVIAQSTPYTPPAKTPAATVFLPIATIVTQNGEEIAVDASGRAEDGSVPVGTTKPVSTGGGNGSGVGSGNNVAGGDLNPDKSKKKSAYDILFEELNPLGLGSLVDTVLKPLIEDPGVSEEQFTTSLRKSDQYRKRFAANEKRIAKGLKPLSEAAYIGLEDKYQEVMRNYGLPESYYSKGEYGVQTGFEQLIANDVSNTELEDRISTAQKRVINANPEVTTALKQFYPDITNGDILAYTLDPKNAIENIKRKVTAAEIGGAALTQKGLTTSLARAEELQKYGVDKEAATTGYSTIGGGLQRGSELAAIYGESPYTQATAESEIFKLSGQQEARKQRQKVTGLEKAAFGGQTGLTSGALARDRAGGI
jgi:hypothetical protein